MDTFALPPGPHIGALRHRLEEIFADAGPSGEGALSVERCLEEIRRRGLVAELRP
jgi:hypothetical protein